MLVGCANWAVTLGRFDVHFSVSTMVRYNAETRKVHLGDMIIFLGYLKHHMKCRIICDTSFLGDQG